MDNCAECWKTVPHYNYRNPNLPGTYFCRPECKKMNAQRPGKVEERQERIDEMMRDLRGSSSGWSR